MAQSGEACCLINLSSAISAGPVPNMSAYAATKYAVEGLTDVLAMELSKTAVHVMSVHPGIINTPIVHDRNGVAPLIKEAQLSGLQAYYAAKGCHPRVVADAIVAGIRKGQDKVFTGPEAKLTAWGRRLAPVRMRRSITQSKAARIGFTT
jgi:short-subunit dehydrogenase